MTEPLSRTVAIAHLVNAVPNAAKLCDELSIKLLWWMPPNGTGLPLKSKLSGRTSVLGPAKKI
jgi:hypothetical protein